MYKQSKYGNLIKIETQEIVIKEEGNLLWEEFKVYQINGGSIEVDENYFTQGEIDTHNTPIYEQKIIDLFTYLMSRALSSSMGKYGSFEYLQIQRNEYLKKYEVAKGISNNVSIANAIVKEMERDFPTPKLDAILTAYGYNDLSGTQIEKMYTLIIIRFEYANGKLEAFEGMAIDFRTKCRTLVELCQWNKLDIAFSLIDNLPTELSNADIENYYLQFENL